ncbi:DMT family transporter [Floridanema evergladense]|uniref:DMT family transporter n=1 Tax=Floridaenema evergladense BLCC-F167 TaxID=3153639 RepID=A0ABV4WX39_9CYAN
MTSKAIKLELTRQQAETNESPNWLALVSLFVGIIGISFAAIFIKLSESELNPYATIFNRLWISTVSLGLINGIQGIHRRYATDPQEEPAPKNSDNFTKYIWLFVGYGTFFAASQIFWAWSITQTSVAISTVLHNLTPLFTCLLAWLLFGQHFDNKFIFGMLIALSGVFAIELEDLQFATGKVQGDLAAVVSAVLVAGYLLIVERLRTKFSANKILLWGSAIATLATIPILCLTQERIFPYSWKGWLFVIGLALVCQIIGQGLIVYSQNMLSSGFVAIAFLLDPVLTSLQAWLIFSERLSVSSWLAFAVVLLGIYFAQLSKSAAKEKNP